MKKTDTVTAQNITMTVGDVLQANNCCSNDDLLGQCRLCPMFTMNGIHCSNALHALSYAALMLALTEEEMEK